MNPLQANISFIIWEIFTSNLLFFLIFSHQQNGQELSELYHELRRMCQDLHRRRENSGHFNSTGDSGIPATPEDINCNHVRPGMISAAFKEYKQLLEEMDDLVCI